MPQKTVSITMLSSCSWQYASLILVCLVIESASGFVRSVAFHRISSQPLHYKVFSVEGEPVWEEEELRPLEENSQTLTLAEVISKDRVGSLARLAAAFSGPGQAVDLKNINQVKVMCVEKSHIDIEAVVCDTERCVTLAIPVNFPNPCTDEGLMECILENIQLLDEQAGDRLRELESAETHREEDDGVWKTLRSTGEMDLPSWWEVCPGMTEDCDQLCSLLNEEGFQAEIRALAIKTLLDSGETDFDVEKAAVAAVCPSGVHLRAQAKRLQKDQHEVVNVPLPFAQPVNDAETLRSAVLNAVMAASSYV
jgi:hypothetical protein